MAPKGVQMGVGVKECQQEMKRKKSTIRIKKETTKIQSYVSQWKWLFSPSFMIAHL